MKDLAPDDEYDAYVVELYRLLIQRRPRHEVVDYLNWAVTENMGLPRNTSRNERVAEKLLSLFHLEARTSPCQKPPRARTPLLGLLDFPGEAPPDLLYKR